MDRKEHLLVLLAEECAELQQTIAKTLRFGLDSEHNGRDNYTSMIIEFNDILAVIELLKDENIEIELVDYFFERKQKKIEKYLTVSKKLGTLDE